MHHSSGEALEKAETQDEMRNIMQRGGAFTAAKNYATVQQIKISDYSGKKTVKCNYIIKGHGNTVLSG